MWQVLAQEREEEGPSHTTLVELQETSGPPGRLREGWASGAVGLWDLEWREGREAAGCQPVSTCCVSAQDRCWAFVTVLLGDFLVEVMRVLPACAAGGFLIQMAVGSSK